MALRAFAALTSLLVQSSGTRVEGEKGGSPVQLSATDESAATTPCSILLQQGTTTVSVEIEGMSRSLIIALATIFRY